MKRTRISNENRFKNLKSLFDKKLKNSVVRTWERVPLTINIAFRPVSSSFYSFKQFAMQYNGFGSKVKIINVKFKKLTAELEWKQTFLHSPFYYGFRAAREKYRFRLQRANKGRTFLEQANTARAIPSDPQRINYFAVLFADLFKLLVGKCEIL